MNMKQVIILCLTVFCVTGFTCAQESVEAIRKEATVLAQQQKFSDATLALEAGLQQYPNNLDLLKDEAYLSYLARDFQRSLQIGKDITARDDADPQSFQILGLTYKAIADYKEGDKMYKSAIKRFPKSGVLYSEYGDMLAQYDNKRGAIVQWEKGIAADPNYSGNYYYATKYYADGNNIFWSCIYGEIFVNIESLSKRTAEIKSLLLNNYKLILSGKSNIENLKSTGNDFEKAAASALSNSLETITGDINPEMITALRIRFILNWNVTSAATYPYRLFDFQLQLMREGLFDAYNQWLFGTLINKDKYDNWVYTHDTEMQDFTQFQHNVLFKMPPEQYYGHQ